MREDSDNTRRYMPVFWRIVVLAAVITAVPVVMWSITTFMRTYVAQPRVPTFRPIATASSAPQQVRRHCKFRRDRELGCKRSRA